MTREIDPVDVIEEYWPYDGPHTHETITTAMSVASGLVRYVNNATQRPPEWAVTIYGVLSGLSGAIHGLDQLLDQAASAMEAQAGDPTLYDDRRGSVVASDTAGNAAGRIEEARAVARELAAALDRARELAVHLGND
jgi:hypothetical protein